MAMNDMRIVVRSLTSRLFGSLTTTITVGVAVALMLVLLSLRDAGETAFLRGSGNMHLVVSRDSSQLEAVLNNVFYADSPDAAIPIAQFEAFLDQPRGPRVPPLRVQTEWAIPTQLGDSFRGQPVVATNREFFDRFQPVLGSPWALAQGKFFDEGPTGVFEVVAGAEAARRANVNVGDRIYMTHGAPRDPAAHVHTEYEYEVVGILEPSGTPHDRALFATLESSWVLHAHDRRRDEGTLEPDDRLTTADLLPADRVVTGVFLRCVTREGSNTSPVLQQVFEVIRQDPRYTVAQPDDQVRGLMQIVSNVDQIFLAMAAVVLVSSGIAIMLAVYSSMEMRRRQIAVLRVLGASKAKIFGLVLTESAVLGVLGGVVGIALAFVGARVTAAVFEARLGLAIDPWPGTDWIVVMMGGAVALAAAAGLVPAAMAYRTSVIRNLRPIG